MLIYIYILGIELIGIQLYWVVARNVSLMISEGNQPNKQRSEFQTRYLG